MLIIAIFLISSALVGKILIFDPAFAEKSRNLFPDITLSVTQFEENKAWASDKLVKNYPVSESGRIVNGSTYERVSWFLKGALLIANNPLGNGISHQAFGHYMRTEFQGSLALMTHSAWIDFTVGLGLPALVFMWMAIFGIVFRACFTMKLLKLQDSANDQSTQFPYTRLIAILAIWLTAGIFLFWIIGEVSERIFIENYFFFLAFFY